MARLAGRARRSEHAHPLRRARLRAVRPPTATSRSTPGSATCRPVVEAAGLERFAQSRCLAGAAIRPHLAARHPEHVTHLVLYEAMRADAKCACPTVAYRRCADLGYLCRLGRSDAHLPARVQHAVPARGHAGANGVVRRPAANSTSAETAAKLYDARGNIDVVSIAAQVQTSTIVLHANRDHVVPVEEGRLLASLIPGARSRSCSIPCTTSCSVTSRPGGPFLQVVNSFLGAERAAARCISRCHELGGSSRCWSWSQRV